MNGHEFLKKIKRLGKQRGVEVAFDCSRGDGSHGTLHYGSCFTTLKDRKKEIGSGLLATMLKDLGLKKSDI